MKVKIGVFQYKITNELPSKKIIKLEKYLAKYRNLDLVICPELFSSGYGNQKKIKSLKEPKNGNFSKNIVSISKKYSTAILYGYPESYKKKIYNSVQLISNKGKSLINHRKKYLPPTSNENKMFNKGKKDSLIRFKGIKTAIVICYELEFPELIRKAALKGAKLIIAPTAQSSLWPAASRYIARSRAFENGVFVVYANYTGRLNKINFLGESKIIGPDGLDICNAKKKEGLIIAEIDTKKIELVRKKLPYLKDSQTK